MHCLKSVRTRNFSGPYFPALGLNTERATPYLFVFSPNAGKYGPEKLLIRTLSRSDGFYELCRANLVSVKVFVCPT